MTIRQQGGIFGRNPTFNNVAVDGILTVDQIVEKTSAAGITLDGVTLKDGNVVLANGKGIDFSATSGTGTSELFDDYEEGTWTPTQGTFTTWTSPTFDAKYTKIGRLVTITLRQTGGTISSGGANYIEGLPYTPLQGGAGSASSGTLAALGSILAWTNGRLYFTAATGSQTSLVATVTYEA
jgi:hypothetical protein